MITDAKIDEQLKSAGVKFLPFVGDSYEYGISFDEEGKLVLGTKEKPVKKVLVLGEYHCCDEEISEEDMNSFTRDVVSLYMEASSNGDKSPWMKTFSKFERAFYNHVTEPNETKNFWEHVMFYNYLQVPLQGSRMAGAEEDYEEAVKPFLKVLQTYEPDYIIVWGKRLYERLPEESGSKGIYVNEIGMDTWIYLMDGMSVNVLPTYHPSVGFSWSFWHKVIVSFFYSV